MTRTMMTMNIVSRVDEMLTSNTTRPAGLWWSGGSTAWGAGNSRLPLMKQTGNWQSRLPASAVGSNGGKSEEREHVDDDHEDQQQPDEHGVADASRLRRGLGRHVSSKQPRGLGHAFVPVPWPV